MHVRQTSTRLVVQHRPRLAAMTALTLWCLAAATGTTLNVLWPGRALLLSLVPVALLSLTGLAVFFTEPRANMWIFDCQVQQMWRLRLGWLGALRPEATMALHEIEDTLPPQADTPTDAPPRRQRNGYPAHLFDNAFRWESDRQRVLCAVCTFLEASRTK